MRGKGARDFSTAWTRDFEPLLDDAHCCCLDEVLLTSASTLTRLATGRGRRAPSSALSDRECTQKLGQHMKCASWKHRNRLHSLVGAALASLLPSDSPKRPRLGRSIERQGLQNPSDRRSGPLTPNPTQEIQGMTWARSLATQIIADHLTTHEKPKQLSDLQISVSVLPSSPC